jgi:hypothetical protein
MRTVLQMELKCAVQDYAWGKIGTNSEVLVPLPRYDY